MARKVTKHFWKYRLGWDKHDVDHAVAWGNPCEVWGCHNSTTPDGRFLYGRELCITHYTALNCDCSESTGDQPCNSDHSLLERMYNDVPPKSK